MQVLTTAFCLALTLGAYHLAKALNLRYRHPLLNVVLLGATFVIAALLVLRIPYQAYVPGRSLMTALLGPATVGLAVPLFRNRDLLRRHAPAILAGIGLGTLTSVLSAGWLATLVALPPDIVLSLLPRSVTIPFAVEIVKLHGGSQALASAFVVATGTVGSVFGATLLTWTGVRDPVARGLALTLAGITTTLLAPLLIRLLVPA